MFKSSAANIISRIVFGLAHIITTEMEIDYLFIYFVYFRNKKNPHNELDKKKKEPKQCHDHNILCFIGTRKPTHFSFVV